MLELASLQTVSFVCLNFITVNRVAALNIRAESISAAEPWHCSLGYMCTEECADRETG